MRFEDLFKKNFMDDEIHAGDPDYLDDEEEEEEGEESSSSRSDSSDGNDGAEDGKEAEEQQDGAEEERAQEPEEGSEDEEEQQQDDQDNDRRRDRDKDKDDKDDKKEKSEDAEKDQSSSEKGDANQDQQAKDNANQNLDEKGAENKKGEAKDAKGSEGQSSDSGKNPLKDAENSRADSPNGPGEKGPGGAGENAPGGEKGPGAMGNGAEKGAEKGVENGAKKAGQETVKNAGAETTKAAATEGVKDAAIAEGSKDAVVAGAGSGAAAGGGAAAAGGGAAAAGGGAAAGAGAGSAAGGGGLISLIGATVPWSLIVIAVIVIIIIIIIIISFFQTLPGSMLENIKRTVKEWFCDMWENFTELFGDEDHTRNVSEDDVNDLARYINKMGYDIQTYGFGDIIVELDEEENIKYEDNRVDKKVTDDGETSDLNVKSKYLKAYLAADECTYHFRSTNPLKAFFQSSRGQEGLIHVYHDSKGWFGNDDSDKLEIDRKSECLRLYNHSLNIPVIDFFKNLFTGSGAFKWGEMVSYDLNTWIGRYTRPVELFLAVHLATMMPDLTYEIATAPEFKTEVNVHFEPIKICLKGNLGDETAYIKYGDTKKSAREIIMDYLSLFEIKRGWFDSDKENAEDNQAWDDWLANNHSTAEIWKVFSNMYEKFSDIENWFVEVWNSLIDWKYITLENTYQSLVDDDTWSFDDEINFYTDGDGHPEFQGYTDPDTGVYHKGFYEYFDCAYNTLARSTTFRNTGKEAKEFTMDDLEDMIDEWNDHYGYEDGDEHYLSLKQNGWGDSGKKEDDNSDSLRIDFGDEGVRLRWASWVDKDDPEVQKKMSLAYLVYKFGTEDIMPYDTGWGKDDQGGLDNMQWPFVRSVKNHWYYKDIDFLGTTEANATYRLAKVGYKTIFYTSENHSTFEMPCALYPKESDDWDFLVYQVAEPVTEGCNTAIKDVFSGEYYRYDGTVRTAKLIANTRAFHDGESQYIYNGQPHDVQDKDLVEKQPVQMPDSPEQALQALAILKNMHTVASDYIYRDLKELFVKLEYYSKEEMTEDLKLMMLWPIKTNNKNEPFEMTETKDKFGKAIIADENRIVLAPMDGHLKCEDGMIKIECGTLNDDAAELLTYIYRNDFYRINKDALKGMTIIMSGFQLSPNINDTDITRGQVIGHVTPGKKVSVTLKRSDDTVVDVVVDDIAEYMREDHNSKYEEIMKRKMECDTGNLPPIPLRSLFGDDDYDGSESNSDTSVDGYEQTAAEVSASEAAKAVYNALKNNFSQEQIAAALGNVCYESGLRTNNLEDSYEQNWGTSDSAYTSAVNAGGHVLSGGTFTGDSAGYGLAQWTDSSRKTSLWNKANNLSTRDVSNLGIQVELLREEMVTGYWSYDWKSTFMNCGNYEYGVMVATKAYCYGFERPGDPESSMQTRISYALGYYNLILNNELE